VALDVFSPGAAGALVLAGARVGGVLLVAPLFSSRTVPARVRTTLLIVLAVVMQPAAFASAASGVAITPASMLTETLIGFAIGFGAAVFVGAADVAGEFLSIQGGLAGSALLDPTSGQSVMVLGRLVQMFVLTLLLALDMHLLILDALAASFRYLPLGAGVDLEAGLASLVSLGAILFSLGLRLAAPVVAAVLIANAALAVLTRAAPQLQILGIAFPLQIGVGLLTLAASIPLMATAFAGWEMQYDAVLTRVLGALRGG
jgi:flagellar biosynthesis protein FliR